MKLLRDSNLHSRRRSPPATRCRQGYSLVEMLVTISIVSLLAGVGTSIIVQMLGFDSTVTQHAERRLMLDQLEDQFREDSRGAVTAQLASGTAQRLEMPQTDGTLIVWQFDPEEVSWSRTQGETRVAADSYPLLLDHVQFEISGRLARLQFEFREPDSAPQLAPAERSVTCLAEIGGSSVVGQSGGQP